MNHRLHLYLVSNRSRFSIIMSVQRRNDEKVLMLRRIRKVLPVSWVIIASIIMTTATSMGNHNSRDTIRIFRISLEIIDSNNNNNSSSIVNYKMIVIVYLVVKHIFSIILTAAIMGTTLTITPKWNLLWELLYSTLAVSIIRIANRRLRAYSRSHYHHSHHNKANRKTSQAIVDTKLVLISLVRWCNNRRHSRKTSRIILRLMSPRVSGEMDRRCCK